MVSRQRLLWMEPKTQGMVMDTASPPRTQDEARQYKSISRQRKQQRDPTRPRRRDSTNFKQRPSKLPLMSPTNDQLHSVLRSVRMTPHEIDFFDVLLEQPRGLQSWLDRDLKEDESRDESERVEDEKQTWSSEALRETQYVKHESSQMAIGILTEIADMDDAWSSWISEPSCSDHTEESSDSGSQSSPYSSGSDSPDHDQAGLTPHHLAMNDLAGYLYCT